MALLDKQKEGFERDAEQKAAKQFSDAFSVVHSITPEAVENQPDKFGLSATNATLVMDKLREGIGAM